LEPYPLWRYLYYTALIPTQQHSTPALVIDGKRRTTQQHSTPALVIDGNRRAYAAHIKKSKMKL
jgi:hypothetical protein